MVWRTAARRSVSWTTAEGRVCSDPVHGVLAHLFLHQIHHRGQMTVLMRQAGLEVPGVYGPSRPEWAHYGMPEPLI